MTAVWGSVVRSGKFVMLGLACFLVAACGGDSGSGSGGAGAPPIGTVKGQVISASNNAVVAGATVRTAAGSTTSAADGTFTLPAPVGERSVAHVEAAGFAEAFPVARVRAGDTTTIGVRLLPTGVTAPITVASGGTVSVPNSTAQVQLPANGLVPKSGGAASASVNVSVTPINPAVDPNLMPGDFTGVSAGGSAAAPIESFGAMLVDIRDSGGTRYNLASGKSSTIRIPLGTRSGSPPTTIPLWFFDDTTGLWNQEGSASLQGTAPDQYYEGTVTHFSYWNADKYLETIFVSGCVRTEAGQPVAAVLVSTNGIDYSGYSSVFTGADGSFRVALRKDSRASLGVYAYDTNARVYVAVTNVINVGPSLVDFSLPNCLINVTGPLTITTLSLPSGTVGVAYNQVLTATGGVPAYTWSLNPGSNPLPAGLGLSASGVISGTPTTAGSTTITVKVTDSAGGTAIKELTLSFTPSGVVPLTITTSVLPTGTVGSAYSTTLAASGGTGILSWSVVSGSLPSGLQLNAATGQISGTPQGAGASTFTVRVRDSGNPEQTADKQLIIIVNPAGGGGGGANGSLTVTGAPAGVGGSFSPNQPVVTSTPTGGIGVSWIEANTDFSHVESLSVVEAASPFGPITGATFGVVDTPPGGSPVTTGWGCGPCTGITLNRAAGIATFNNTVLTDPVNGSSQITISGTLTFTPF